LGLGDSEEKNLPTKIPFFQNTTIIDVTTGYGHTLFVTNDFKVYVVGDNRVKTGDF
jgi:alpha-tubulin suppressor-like RCC1 family protein